MKLRAWVQAFRLKFLPQGVMPVVIGTAIAYRVRGVFFLDLFLLTFFGMMLTQFGLTMLDDWHDFKQGTDKSRTDEKNPYSGGSGVLVDGSITTREMISVVVIFYLIVAGIGIYLAFHRGIMIFYIMLVGLFISIFYSLKPFQFAYRGLGEVSLLLGYGPIITLGAYFVQTKTLSTVAFLGGLLPGMLMWVMIIVNEFPDYEEDKKNNKRNLVVILGKEQGIKLFSYGLAAIYFYIGLMAYLKVFPTPTLLALLSMTFAAGSIKHLKAFYNDRLKVSDANREMVKVYSATTILFAIGLLL